MKKVFSFRTLRAAAALAFVMVVLLPALSAADVDGKWNFVVQTADGERHSVVEMKADGDAVTGKWDQQDLKGNFKDGKLVLDFPLTVPEYDLQGTLKVDATVENGKIKGNWTYNEYYGSLSATKAE